MAQIEVKNSLSLTAITFCLWVASKSGLFVEYNATSDKQQYRAFGLISYSTVELVFMENATRYVHCNEFETLLGLLGATRERITRKVVTRIRDERFKI